MHRLTQPRLAAPVRRLTGLAGLLCAVTAIGAGFAASAAPAADVAITNPWFRFITPQVPAGGYATLRNTSPDPAVLTQASSSACGSLMIHHSMASGSTEMMMPVASVTIPAGGTVAFSPGGYHLMCMQPRMKPGDSIPVTFTFQNGATLDTQFKVVGATGRPPHSGS